jgi:hypothetical protein
VVGIQKNFGYMAHSDGSVLQRWFDCWCNECTVATGPGAGMAEVSDSLGYHVIGCTRHEPEPWYECSVELKGTRGYGARKRIAQAKGRELAEKLKPGTFVVVQDRTASAGEEHYLVGITVDVGDGSCIVRHVQGDDREHIDGTRFDPGDYAIVVQWLSRLAEDPAQRTFEVNPEAREFIINSTELRYSSVELDLVVPTGPALRRSSRAVTQAQSSHGQVLHRKYIISIETEQAILQRCC